MYLFQLEGLSHQKKLNSLFVSIRLIVTAYFIYILFQTVSPAFISRQPYNQIVAQGDVANFSVIASGDGLTYQWQRNDTNITGNGSRFEGVFDAVLTIHDAKVEDAGVYKCIVFNGAGDSVTSNEVTLTVSK